VRADAIQRVKATRPDVSAEIAHHNHDALTGPPNAERLQAFTRAIDAIRLDRDASYADLASHPNPS
jgi:hypothetical protein